jgi:pyruvate carboxylase
MSFTSSSVTVQSNDATRKSSRSRRPPTSTRRCATNSVQVPSPSPRFVGYRNAGTVEFLVDAEGRYVFIEMNPRIQVEHTVTDEVTSIDLVQSQLRIASGETLSELGIDQANNRVSGAAMQCRITTENPAKDFRPDTGRITTYVPGGAGVRLDDGTYVGAEIPPYFDSLLVSRPVEVARLQTPSRARGVRSPNFACVAWRRTWRSFRRSWPNPTSRQES